MVRKYSKNNFCAVNLRPLKQNDTRGTKVPLTITVCSCVPLYCILFLYDYNTFQYLSFICPKTGNPYNQIGITITRKSAKLTSDSLSQFIVYREKSLPRYWIFHVPWSFHFITSSTKVGQKTRFLPWI